MHLRNNAQLLFPKINNTKNDKKIQENQKTKTPTNNQKRPSSVKKNGNNIEALDLDIHQSTDNLKKILRQYKKEEQDNYSKVVDDFVTNLENEINSSQKKNPFLDSLDLGGSGYEKKIKEIKNGPNQTFGVKKIDFTDNKIENEFDKQSLEELIGYESENDENEKKQEEEERKIKNIYSKPFSANNVSRNEIINTTKQLKTENNVFGKNERVSLMENQKFATKNGTKIETKNGDTKNGDTKKGDTKNGDTKNGDTKNGDTKNGDSKNCDTKNYGTKNETKNETKNWTKNETKNETKNGTKNSVVRDVSLKKNENKTPPKSQNSQRRAPSYEPKTRMQNGKNEQKERNSKFRNKLFEDIENSKKIKENKNFNQPIAQKKDKISTEYKTDHVIFFFFLII